MPLFDAYLMVDWSASTKRGGDGIRACLLERDREPILVNPQDRDAAVFWLADRLSDLAARGRRVLCGFDFAFGYPAGFAARLAPRRPDWSGVWRALAARETASLGDLDEPRLCERRVDEDKPVRQRFDTGLPRLHELRHWQGLEDVTRVWPFETGLRIPDETAQIVLAEVHPSPIAGGRPDDDRVPALARHFADLDDRESLASLFAPALPDAERTVVEKEEGWILGVGASDPFDYVRDPAEIYRLSWERVRMATDLSGIPADLKGLAERLVHTAGDPAIVRDLAFGEGAGEAGRKALAVGAPILCDVEMVAQGITRSRLTKENPVLCHLNAPDVRDRAAARGITRAMAAVDLWLPHLDGAVVAIGNAPTALFRLLELLRDGAPMPALILGFPVGFVGAAESKEALIRFAGTIPHVTLRGRRGGSALAAAAVNALAGDQP
jgi:precorrin-8X/cobalt-precorrin-8 methylmutase